MKVSIIKYNAGNIISVYNALHRLGINADITDNPEEILNSDKVIFPGVGEASTTMKYLKEHKLDSLIKNLKQPVLGICLGMQLMCKNSEEGNTDCLGIFDLNVKRFDDRLKVPHMGWNNLTNLKGKLFDFDQPTTINEQLYVYFIHSFYAEKGKDTSAITDYGIEFSSALEKDNFYSTQFHPEKSGKAGERILKNFLKL
jgi:imidazole glycerol-phosphate synthase subunit HisH